MEVVTSPKCSTTSDADAACSTASIWQDVLAQAVTGELVAVLNYTSLAEICQDPDEVADALEHAESERGHATAFTAEGKKLGIEVPNNVNAKYWKRAPQRVPSPDRWARLYRLSHHSGGHARVLRRRQLQACRTGRAGQPGHDLRGNCRRGRRPHRSCHVYSQGRAGARCPGASMTRCMSFTLRSWAYSRRCLPAKTGMATANFAMEPASSSRSPWSALPVPNSVALLCSTTSERSTCWGCLAR